MDSSGSDKMTPLEWFVSTTTAAEDMDKIYKVITINKSVRHPSFELASPRPIIDWLVGAGDYYLIESAVDHYKDEFDTLTFIEILANSIVSSSTYGQHVIAKLIVKMSNV